MPVIICSKLAKELHNFSFVLRINFPFYSDLNLYLQSLRVHTHFSFTAVEIRVSIDYCSRTVTSF